MHSTTHCPQCVLSADTENPNIKFHNQYGTLLIVLKFSHSAAESTQRGLEHRETIPWMLSYKHNTYMMARLQCKRQVTYRTLTYIFSLSDGVLERIKRELDFTQLERNENDERVIWRKPHSLLPHGMLQPHLISTRLTILLALMSAEPLVAATNAPTNQASRPGRYTD